MDVPILAIINWFRKLVNWDEIKRIKVLFNRCRSPIKVVVFGESGVGKTQFINTITGNHKYSKIRTREIIHGNTLVLPNGRRLELIDTPGQISYKNDRNKLNPLFLKGEIKGLVNLVAFGYLAKPETRETDAFKTGTNEVKPKFLKNNRQLELNQAEEWVKMVNTGKNVKWVLTVINKADIWFSQEREVTEFYELKEYRKNIIDKVSSNCRWKLLPFCSTMTDFLHKPLPRAIDSELKEELHSVLIQELEDLATG